MDGVIDPPSSAHRLTPASLAEKTAKEFCFVARKGDRLVGCVFAGEHGDALYVGKLAVDPAEQGNGIGRRLIAAVEDLALRLRKPALELETRVELTGNPAFFRRMGFVEVGRTAHAGYDRPTSITFGSASRDARSSPPKNAPSPMAGRRGCGDGHAHRRRECAAARRVAPDPHRFGAHRRRALSWRFRHAFRREAGRGRRDVAVRSTLNVGALDLMGCSRVRLEEPCARHGATHDGGIPQAWLRAELDLRALPGRTPARLRHGCRLGRVQRGGLLQLGARRTHKPLRRFPRHRLRDRRPRARLRAAPAENRRATLVFDVSALPASFLASEIAWPVLGSLYGREVGNAVGVVAGISAHPGEDALKAFGAAAASSGAVGLFHIAGVHAGSADAGRGARRRSARKRPSA